MSQAQKRIMILDPDPERADRMVELMEAEDHFAYAIEDMNRAMQQIYNEAPDLIIMTAIGDRWKTFLRTLKNDSVYRYLPVLGLFEEGMLGPTTTFEGLPIDDLLLLPLNLDELRLRVRLAIVKSSRYLDANPLSRLPGNYTILQTVQNLIDNKTPFALGYIDIDNFKPFNDRYGFSRGDEIIRMTARIMTNAVRGSTDAIGFVGHIGGDDFVLIVEPQSVDTICKQVLFNFDMIASTFYDDEDRMRGYIESVDRKGNKNRFPLLSLSIAAVISINRNFTHYGEFSAAASEVKKAVKQLDGSNYMVDRRHDKNENDDPQLALVEA
ncbi:MAG TPA: diguanylate cyclase [bacterium]|nr:diguanylate cyclase [bacterium]